MSDTPSLAAKVLLLEHDPSHYRALLDFCDSVGLMPLPCTAPETLPALVQHKDLGGVLLAEDLPCEGSDALALARAIHLQRPELPIFLRRTRDVPLAGGDATAVQHPWPSGDLDALRARVDDSLFKMRYPADLVQGVIDLTRESLAAMFPGAEVTYEPPYIVHDRIIFGQVSTLIPIESTWCRGYMMLQTEEAGLRQGVIQGLGLEGSGTDLGFRALNHLLAETTNLIWGAFKNRYIPPEAFAYEQTQVPIVINHEQKYISFGSSDPQLCLRWRLADPRRAGLPPLTIVQRMIFNLLWSPEEYARFAAVAPTLQPAGVLELF